MAAPFGPPPVVATMVCFPSGATRVSVPRLISTTNRLPSASATGPSGNWRPLVISRISGMVQLSASPLAVVGGEPALGLHGDEHRGGVLGGRRPKVRLAHLRAEIAERRRPDVALVVGRGDRRRALDGHVAVGRCLGLHADAHPSRGADEARLTRLTAGHEAERRANEGAQRAHPLAQNAAPPGVYAYQTGTASGPRSPSAML